MEGTMVSKPGEKSKKWWLIGIVLIFLVVLASGTLYYLGFFGNKGTTSAAGKVKLEEAQKTGRAFDKAELAQFDGKNGQPSYVAVDGVVYDLSMVFKDGTHHSHQAGEELTDAFFSKHAASRIQKYPVVGVYLAN
jgi:predicted heme/steroid binding protein